MSNSGEASAKQRPPAPRPGTVQSIAQSMRSWRTASVALLSFASGLPLGLVTIAIPDWMRSIGLDIRLVGLMTLAQAPWTFKILWSPLMDRYAPPWLGRRRGWAAIAQVALFALTLVLAGVGHHPESPWVVAALALAIAFASATQDIAIDAYAVDVLRPEEQGTAVGARIAVYRAAMLVSGGLSITLAARYSWPLVNLALALLYLPMLVITWRAPEPEEKIVSPASLRDAIWQPFLGFLAKHRALEMLAFVVFYKFADQMAQSLTRPFLADMGYGAFDRGFALATLGLAATLLGTFIGGLATTAIGLGHSLWIFGFLQTFAGLGYFVLAGSPVNVPLMYGATAFELLTSGMGTGAFSVLLLRMTERRFSATQYALFSSLFGLPRLLSGPLTGVLVDAAGWRAFFLITIACGAPGMILLSRFVPLGVREPAFGVEPTRGRERLSGGALAWRGVAGGTVGLAVAALLAALLSALKATRTTQRSLDLLGALAALARPADPGAAIQLLAIGVVGLVSGLFTAATFAARQATSDPRRSDER